MKVSIITINLNNLAGLEKTLDSVCSQSHPVEYIVIDGGSKDGSVDAIKKRGEKIGYWISEPDKGIYNAMNKGIPAATGDYLLFLNSGDTFYNENVVADFVKNAAEAKDLYSGTIAFDKHGRRNYEEAPEKPTFGFFFKNTLRHPCTFIKRSLFDRFGVYNESNKIASDWEFFLEAASDPSVTYQKLNFPVALFDVTGVGNNPDNYALIDREREAFMKARFGFYYIDYQNSRDIENNYLQFVNSRAHLLLSKLLKIFRR